MKRILVASAALAVTMWAAPSFAAEKLIISSWGGSWKELIEQTVAKKFKAETGADVEFVTGGTIDRLNKAKLAKGSPESDVTFTTSHVGWLYANDGLYETLDMAKIPNAKFLVDQAKISPYHIGSWAYVYTIVYRPDLVPADIKFDSWADLWKPELKGKLSAPDFDTSHLVAVAAKLEGADAANWEKGSAKLKALKPNFKAYYANDAASQQLMQNGEAPVQVMLSMNAYYIASQGVKLNVAIPKEGAVLGVDTIGIMKGSKNADLAYKFVNILLDPEVQKEIATVKKGSPVVTNAKLDPEVAKLPGVFTTPDQWNKESLVIDHKLRAEKTGVWRQWFTENVIN
ncbi:ABC transporter substrate-binding protein [Pseudorhodoplanes sinuspersici]|uniref:ABC transporter substrate-binding protein n=1 Tax=Pseudorhodoplanes sinuspersici TaxID=1235591 RepID=A0A1W7A0A2_9HYPH|nr:ABC transporter substrate-binding protein [Pseudorhodoplanes sinuspersici]ARQ03026.1 ABC transporter substrate-binding protein [Pseudorhodoplanes sinuspersici]RKE72154.1 putative spermidine/putrescine transport system substrate-binding protein [Pseudorhodoplanes sinuspersici]